MSGVAEERISAYYYRISLLKLQVHSKMLYEPTSQQHSTPTVDENNVYQRELDAWMLELREEIMGMGANSDPPNDAGLVENWAALQYHHTALLIDYFPGIPNDGRIYRYSEIIKACNNLSRMQQKAMQVLVHKLLGLRDAA